MRNEILLSKDKVAIVPENFYDELSKYKWSADSHHGRFRAVRVIVGADGRQHTIYLHRVIWELAYGPIEKGKLIDHIDQNPLNNALENLRICNHAQNVCNQKKQAGCSSRYKGVCWDNRYGKWMAYIKCDRKFRFIGYFIEEADAARAYDVKAKELFGEFASPNF